jgi:hypothetical protein
LVPVTIISARFRHGKRVINTSNTVHQKRSGKAY